MGRMFLSAVFVRITGTIYNIHIQICIYRLYSLTAFSCSQENPNFIEKHLMKVNLESYCLPNLPNCLLKLQQSYVQLLKRFESTHRTLCQTYKCSINFIKPACYNIRKSRSDKCILSSYIVYLGRKRFLTDDIKEAYEKQFSGERSSLQNSRQTLERIDTRYTTRFVGLKEIHTMLVFLFRNQVKWLNKKPSCCSARTNISPLHTQSLAVFFN